MQRQSISFTDRQIVHLAAIKQEIGIDASEYIRRILDAQIDGTLMQQQQTLGLVDGAQPQERIDSSVTGGSRPARLWVSTLERIIEIRRRYPHIQQIALLDRLVNMPDDLLDQVLTGTYDPRPDDTGPSEPQAIPMPDGGNHNDQFLAEYCAQGRGLVVRMADVLQSYSYFCSELGIDQDRPADFWDHVMARGFVVTRQTGTVTGLGLLNSAYAVLMGDAVGVKLTS